MSARVARVGVVGTGWWCTRVHLPSLASYERARIVAVADADPARARAVGERFAIDKVYGDHTALLEEDLDVVLVATPPAAHFEATRDALSAGADVLVEKPMVIDPAEGRILVSLAAATGRRLHVGYPYLHSAHARLLAREIADGAIGELRLVSSLFASPTGILYSPFDEAVPADAMFGPRFETYGVPGSGGGQAHGQLTHSLSLMLAVTGLHPREVSAYAWGAGLDVDLVDAAIVATAEGPLATVSSTGTVPIGAPSVLRLSVFGTDGHATLDATSGELEMIAADGSRTAAASLSPSARFPERLPARHLVDCYLDGTEPRSDGVLGLATAVLIDTLLKSAAMAEPRRVLDPMEET